MELEAHFQTQQIHQLQQGKQVDQEEVQQELVDLIRVGLETVHQQIPHKEILEEHQVILIHIHNQVQVEEEQLLPDLTHQDQEILEMVVPEQQLILMGALQRLVVAEVAEDMQILILLLGQVILEVVEQEAVDKVLMD